MYSPDRNFLKQLKKLDPKLGCHYEPDHQHFVITYDRPYKGKVPILCVEDKATGGFRPPDNREIQTLKEYDTHRVDMSTRLKHTATYMERVREKDKKDAADNIRNMTKDSKNQLASGMARLVGGKHNSTFRRIEPKKKGLTAAEIINQASARKSPGLHA